MSFRRVVSPGEISMKAFSGDQTELLIARVNTSNPESLEELLEKVPRSKLEGRLCLSIGESPLLGTVKQKGFVLLLDRNRSDLWKQISFDFWQHPDKFMRTIFSSLQFCKNLEILGIGTGRFGKALLSPEFSSLSRSLMLGSFMKLNSLSLSGINWTGGSQFALFCRSLAHFPSLTKLGVDHCDFDEHAFYRFSDALCSKKEILEELHLTFYDFDIKVHLKFGHYFRALAKIIEQRRVKSLLTAFVNDNGLNAGLRYLMYGAAKGKTIFNADGKEEPLKVIFGIAFDKNQLFPAYREIEKSITLDSF